MSPPGAGEILTNSFRQVVHEVPKSQFETRMTVTFRSFQAEDVGSYRCISKNSLGEVENSIRLYGESSLALSLSLALMRSSCFV